MATVLDRQRLLKLKCPSCGSHEKHEVNIQQEGEILGKIVTCNQCGHTTDYWVCALAKAHYVAGQGFWKKSDYNEWVKNEHRRNHGIEGPSRKIRIKKS